VQWGAKQETMLDPVGSHIAQKRIEGVTEAVRFGEAIEVVVLALRQMDVGVDYLLQLLLTLPDSE
jgi:hypothetical protein